MADSSETPAKPLTAPLGLLDRPNAWLAIAMALFLLIGLVTFLPVLVAGPASHALSKIHPEMTKLDLYRSDVQFEAYLVSRHAHTLVHSPLSLFDTEHCAPANKTLSLGIHMITMGLLAIPVRLITPNPALAFNFATLMLWLAAGLSMYLLVKEWTAQPAAGVIAGIVYAYAPLRLGFHVSHPSVWDSAWIVFAIFFARRLFAYGRWRDAVGLSIACALQIGASFYPLLASIFLTAPFIVWLFACYGLRHITPAQIAFVAISVCGAAGLLLGPYLISWGSGDIGSRTYFGFTTASDLLPSGKLFLGWMMLALAAVGMGVRRKQIAPRLGGDPRWPLLGGAVIAIVISAGPNNNELLHWIWNDPPFQIPNFYALLSAYVPGFDSIRVIWRFSVALQVALSILAGIGAAWLIRFAAGRETVAAVILILLSTLSVIGNPFDLTAIDVKVKPEEQAFYQALEELGNEGPVFEVPIMHGLDMIGRSPRQIMLVSYHGRRTSTCFGSYQPSRYRLGRLERRLPDAVAVKELADHGFTTIVLRHALPRGREVRHRLNADEGQHLRIILESDAMTAYEVIP